MLVSIHKHWYILFLLLSQSLQAQLWTAQQCADTALVRQKGLQIAQNQQLISTVREKEAKAQLLPKLSAHADYKYFTNLPYQLLPLAALNPSAAEGLFREAQFGVPHNIGVDLRFSMPLYQPQIKVAIASSHIASELSSLQLHQNEEQVYVEVLGLYYQAQIIRNRISFSEANLRNAEKLLRTTQLLQSQLLATGTDVSRVELQLQQLQTERRSLQGKYAQAQNALKSAMGLPLSTELQVDSSISVQSEQNYSQASTLAVQLAETKHRLAEQELEGLRKAKVSPSINLFGTLGTTGFGYDGQPSAFLKFYPIGFAGLQVSYPIFNGNINRQQIERKQLEANNSELQLQWIAEKSELQTENARLQRRIAAEALQQIQRQEQLAQKIYEQSLLQQKEDLASLSDVLLADNALRQAQQQYLEALIDYLKADLDLKKSTGNLQLSGQ